MILLCGCQGHDLCDDKKFGAIHANEIFHSDAISEDRVTNIGSLPQLALIESQFIHSFTLNACNVWTIIS